MTVCIAAACFSTDRPAAIVLCSDKRIETEYLAADIGHKLEVAGPRWVAMVSGTVFRAKQLISCYRNHLTPDVIASMSEHNVQGVLQEAPIQQKLNLIEEYFQTRWAISYGDFKETGKDFFPSDIYARIVLEIE